ncbi:MAG TPA: DUF4139 domain-containing protein, partial [Gemmataceae bacterium]
DRYLAAKAAAGKQDLKPAVSLPMSRVVLFNSGVGYFTRAGEVDGDARVDLAFQESDVNDLLKSMVLEDFNNGRISAVSYDSREPISRTLASFAINLDDDPSYSQILSQARGERVEVTMQPTAQNQPGKLIGAIVGLEGRPVLTGKQPVEEITPPADRVMVLNLWCAEGLRSVKVAEIQQLRFLNPALESEIRRALEVLARNHDSQKKAVSLHFSGDGKRKVQVSYVVEAPLWKTSYRLMLDAKNKSKPHLQGWAIVENPTDEDWTGVKMALISGRPISFQMDLYNPLYVPRPTVEPELFASLRPPTYDGGFNNGRTGLAMGGGGMMGMGGMGMMGGGIMGVGLGGMPAKPADPSKQRYQKKMDAAMARLDEATIAERKRYAGQLRRELVEGLQRGAVGSEATGGQLGDFFQYAIDHPVSLARQKSAMLPIVNKDVEGSRVSIYNAEVQPKHPLLGLRFKNTSGLHLAQGPITVFEGSTYAGDTRVLDVQPNEERLVSYAIDLGTEVDPQTGAGTSKITSVKAVKGFVTTITKVREVKKYSIANRSQQGRTLIIEHPNRTNDQFRLVETEKPMEDTKDFYRFQTNVKAGEEKAFTVSEERDVNATVAIATNPDGQIRYFLSLNEASPALKEKLKEALGIKSAWDGSLRELNQVVADLNRLNQDQDRIRKNLANTPKEAEVYRTYLKKLSDQEKEIDELTAKQKKQMGEEFAARKKFESYLANLSD